MNPLREFFDSRRPDQPGIWKWDHYFDAYHRHLSKFNKPINMLEIGVLGGGSLEMWKGYFQAGSTILLQSTCSRKTCWNGRRSPGPKAGRFHA